MPSQPTVRPAPDAQHAQIVHFPYAYRTLADCVSKTPLPGVWRHTITIAAASNPALGTFRAVDADCGCDHAPPPYAKPGNSGSEGAGSIIVDRHRLVKMVTIHNRWRAALMRTSGNSGTRFRRAGLREPLAGLTEPVPRESVPRG
jgi:hypothetical protein